MTRTRRPILLICMVLVAGLIGLATVAHAADDTARFYGTWKTTVVLNGQRLTVILRA
jgi:hypothetical protein